MRREALTRNCRPDETREKTVVQRRTFIVSKLPEHRKSVVRFCGPDIWKFREPP